jgi:cytoskeletal protein CcmA (bactofilin family)
MALFGQQPRKDEPVSRPEPVHKPPETRIEPPHSAPVMPPASPVTATTTRRVEEAPMSITAPKGSESILSAGLTIEGKIEGNGNIRVAGRFKGNVNVKGELTIEPGASIDGEVKADTVLVGGEVRGHLIANSRVEFKESGTLIGDLKAGSLTVAAGSKMRGKVEFGWKEGEVEALHPPEPKTPAH